MSAVAPLAVFPYLLFSALEGQSGVSTPSGDRWADALQVAAPAAAVELGIIVVVLLWGNAVSSNPASPSARAVAVATAAVCAGLPTTFFVGLPVWPLVLLSCVVPAALIAPALMRSAAAITPSA